ncbi:hypothetical protein JKF63_04989 [Porcisia hertigi]|uniref:Protein kinase domain-containing protein n=1 Tax=Porcisia hertigi TaxID=2761500 RepID=A0A836LBD7_9TRYP|nr:hypothetical protein JKF63_04989 [Porcisia hertigi]
MEKPIFNAEADFNSKMPRPNTHVEKVLTTNVIAGSRCLEETLRIETPTVASGPCTTPVSPADRTGINSPQTAVYCPSETAFYCEAEKLTLHSAEGQDGRESASALLLPPDDLQTAGSKWREADRPQPLVTPTFSYSEPVDATRRKSSISLFTSSSQRVSDNWPTPGGVFKKGRSSVAERTSGGEPDGVNWCSAVVNPSSGSFEAHPALATVIVPGSSSTPPLPERSGPTSHSSTLPTLPVPLADKEHYESSDSSQHGIATDFFLQDASKIRGLRLTWLLYLLIVMVIVLLVLVLVQITYETNRMLTQSATEVVQVQAASLLNGAGMQQYELEKLFGLMRNINVTNIVPNSALDRIAHDSICSSLFHAPIAFALYSATGKLEWKRLCKQYESFDLPARFPETVMPDMESVRVVDYGEVALAYRTFSSSGIVETYMVMMNKETLGLSLMNNRMVRYSVATLESVVAVFFVRGWNTTHLTVLFHTLRKAASTYTDTPTLPSAAALVAIFDSVCVAESPYVWHTVLMPKNTSEGANLPIGMADDWPATTSNPIPRPHLEYKRSWSQLSRANLCGVQCTSAEGDKCALDNPTNVWFLVDHPLTHQYSSQTTVTIIGAVSIVAVVIFSVVLLLVYISITVPVSYLRCQLMRAAGCKKIETLWQRRIVRWTHRLWLADLTSITRSIYTLSLCFRLNKKYVPDHVLRNHARRPYMRRRKAGFLYDVEGDPAVEDSTDSEDEAHSPQPLLAGVSAALPISDAHFLWNFSRAHDVDQTSHTALESGMKCPTVGAKISGGPTLAEEASPAYALRPLLPSTSHEMVTPCGKAPPAMSGATMPCDVSHSLGGFGGLDDTVGTLEASATAAASTKIHNSSDIMNIRRDYESTVLCIRILGVEMAYLINYSGAVCQHRRLMRVLLHRIRRHKGALFHCAGDSLGAVWNAFESCSNHAEGAAVCAQEIANAFAPYRSEGLHIGMVLHQGTLVCGTVEYSTTAFVTAFGDGPREALAVAELAATVNTLNVLVTEPVKQALSGLYDCNIVDVIQLPNSSHPLLLFELSGSRAPERLQYDTPLETPSRAQFSIEYARAFAQFRNHEFSEALESIQKLRAHNSSCNAHLLRRLERLCLFYSTQSTVLPFPYHRSFPVWSNYEAIAQAGLRGNPHLMASRSESLLVLSRNRGLVYQRVPELRDDMDCIRDFKQELQANMRRLGSPQQSKRHRSAPAMDDFSTSTYHSTQLSLPMRPMSLPTPAGDGLPLVVSGNIPNPRTATVSTLSRYVDPLNSAVGMGSSPLPPIHVVTATTLESIQEPPLAAVTAKEKKEGPNSPDQSSSEASSSVCVPFLSGPFSRHGIRNLPSVFLPSNSDLADACPALLQSAVIQIDSTHSTVHAEDINASIIQSAGLSFEETYGMRSFCVRKENLPAAIKAKNGTTYLRSSRILGKGSFGCVYLGMDAHSGRLIAIKFLPLPSDEAGMKVIEAEVLTLQRVNDSHVVQLLSYAFEGDNIVIFMECMLAGSLQNIISSFRTIPSSTARVFMRDILRGLGKLHSMGIIHRDMKPQNVLLSFTGHCKISDFGASAWLQELARKESEGEVFGTPVYLAPEAARGNPEEKSDIWSCGIMFLQMITGHLPYSPEQLASGAAALVYQIGSGITKPKIPDNLNVLDVEFVYACLDDDPSRRTSVAGLLQLAIFTV